ncbi:MAG: hypothetical protein H6626_08810 [Pseudobdellovibrionaceae bacterium]|nr:MAG: hypothetical protein H6626_08810 [Pseudobdellovibrionaceae bacterium]
MRLDFHVSGSWQAANSYLTKQLGLEGLQCEAKVYRGLHHALIEVTQGLVKNFPTKKKIFCFKDQDPFLEAPLRELAKQGLPVIRWELSHLEDPSKWIEQVDREALMVVYADDDPLLGRVFNTNPLTEALADLRVFRIHASHSQHCYLESPVYADRYEVKIMSMNPEVSLVVHGDKARMADMVSSGMYWPQDLYQDVALKFDGDGWRKSTVVDFEKTQAGGFTPVFNPEDLRVYDRAVIYWEDMDGYAFIDELARELGFELESPGEESRLETPSLSRWGGVRTMDWLHSHGLGVNAIRGTVMIDVNLIDNNLPNLIQAVRAKVLSRQQGPSE